MRSIALVVMLIVSAPGRVFAAEASPPGITIDVPVVLKEAKIVFNLDHPAFEATSRPAYSSSM